MKQDIKFHAKRIIIACAAVLSLQGCQDHNAQQENQKKLAIPVKIDCKNAKLPDWNSLSVMDNPDLQSAISRTSAYLNYVSCNKAFPQTPFFKAYFFTPDMIGSEFTVVEFNEGFNKVPGSLKADFSDGLKLLFCFNKMVINCEQAAECECPYDFNRLPKKRP